MNRLYILLTMMVVMVGALSATHKALAKVLSGTSGEDTLVGTDRADRLDGREGEDSLKIAYRLAVQSSPRGSGSRTLRVHHLREAARLPGSGLHRMQILADFESPYFRSEGCSPLWSRSCSGPCPCSLLQKATRLTANASSERTASDGATPNTTPGMPARPLRPSRGVATKRRGLAESSPLPPLPGHRSTPQGLFRIWAEKDSRVFLASYFLL